MKVESFEKTVAHLAFQLSIAAHFAKHFGWGIVHYSKISGYATSISR